MEDVNETQLMASRTKNTLLWCNIPHQEPRSSIQIKLTGMESVSLVSIVSLASYFSAIIFITIVNSSLHYLLSLHIIFKL